MNPMIVDRQVAGAEYVARRSRPCSDARGAGAARRDRRIDRERRGGPALSHPRSGPHPDHHRFLSPFPATIASRSCVPRIVPSGSCSTVSSGVGAASFVRPSWCDSKRRKTPVQVHLEGDQGAQTVRTRWLVGCDGMHSRVRDQSGIAFRGAAYEVASSSPTSTWIGRSAARKSVCSFRPKACAVVAALPEQRFRIVATFDDAPETPSATFLQDLLDQRGPTQNRGRIHDRGMGLPIPHSSSRRGEPAQGTNSSPVRGCSARSPAPRAGRA